MKKKLITLIYTLVYMNTAFTQSSNFIQAQDSATKYILENHLKDQHNSYVDRDNVIHIFIFENGNLLIKGYPTTATEKNKFQLHLFASNSNTDVYLLEYVGSYTPIFTLQNSIVSSRGGPAKIVRTDFAILGPFTNTLTLTLKHKIEGST